MPVKEIVTSEGGISSKGCGSDDSRGTSVREASFSNSSIPSNKIHDGDDGDFRLPSNRVRWCCSVPMSPPSSIDFAGVSP